MIKTDNDYYDKLYEMFPDVPKENIRAAVKYGWQKFYGYNLEGCDMVIKDGKSNDFWMYIGELYGEALKHFQYYRMKLIRKIREKYRRKHKNETPDNVYYIPIPIDAYNKAMNNKLKFYHRYVYKIMDEAKIRIINPIYIFKIKLPFYAGKSFKLNFIDLNNAELMYIRDHALTMNDLKIESKNYEYV